MKGGPGQKGLALLPCAPAASPPGQHRGPRPGWPRVGGGSSSVMSRHASLRRRERAPFPHLLGHRARFQERLVPRRPGPPCRLDDGRTNEKARHRTQHMPVVARGASCGRGQSRGLPRGTQHPTRAPASLPVAPLPRGFSAASGAHPRTHLLRPQGPRSEDTAGVASASSQQSLGNSDRASFFPASHPML